jgi:rhodanese-related sulfurtransferase
MFSPLLNLRKMEIFQFRFVISIACVLIACVFLCFGISKLFDGVLFTDSVAGYEMLPAWGVNVVAVVLPILEVVLGVAVLVRKARRAALGMMGVLLGVFIVALVQAIVRGLEIDCGCFGGAAAGKSSLYWAVARDVVLLGIVMFLLKQSVKAEVAKDAGNAEVLKVLLRVELCRAGLLVCGAVLLAVGVNLLREKPLGMLYQNPKARVLADAGALKAQGRGQVSGADTGNSAVDVVVSTNAVADIEEVAEVAAKKFGGRVLLVDARPDVFFEDGHIAGAINLPSGEFKKVYPAREAALKAAKRIIVYCDGGGCESSAVVVSALRELGFGNVAEYKGGWREFSGRNTQERREYDGK